jgi:death-on-curing family protein
MKQKLKSKGKVIVYKNRVEVRLEAETVWLTQKQMADLFQKDIRTINEHIINVYKEKELQRKATIRKFRIVQKEGKRKVSRNVDFYNLDMILSVGYRVNSKRGTQFRIWVTNVLSKHLVDGYTLNQKRLAKDIDKYKELQKAIDLIDNIGSLQGLSAEAKGIISVISDYKSALDILDDFDYQNLKTPKGTKKAKYKLTYEKSREIIDVLRKKFKDSGLVGQEKDQSFKSSVNAIYQTFDKKALYPTAEEKAAYLLYFVVKNHSFVDGNKRIAAALFVCFLEKNGLLCKKDGSRIIDNNALVGLTLMIASSRPKEKDKMIRVVLNLLHNK